LEPIKVVVHYSNGKVIKGVTQDFFPHRDRFHLYSASKPSGDATEVIVKELKAIFFVRDFLGNRTYKERKKYLEGEEPHGRKIEVTFADGEIMVGSTLGYDLNRPGFFIFPADTKGNNIRVFAVTPAVKKVRYS